MADLRESLIVDAPADLVYDLVADPPQLGEWSPECERVTGHDQPPRHGPDPDQPQGRR